MTSFLKIHTLLILFFSAFCAVFAAESNPLNLGKSAARNANGSAVEASMENPALLGVESAPKGGVVPPLFNFGVEYYSNVLALRPYRDFLSIGNDPDTVDNTFFGIINLPYETTKTLADITNAILHETFDLQGLDAQQSSEEIFSKLKDGVSIYAGYRYALLHAAHNRFSLGVSTYMDEEVTIPGAAFALLFSTDQGLQKGNSLELSSFNHEKIHATEFSFQVGLPVMVPELQKLFGLRYGAGGIGVKYIAGHSFYNAYAERAELSYNDDGYEIDADVLVRTTENRAPSDNQYLQDYRAPFAGSFTPDGDGDVTLSDLYFSGVTGHGFGLDIGGILYDEHQMVSVNFSNIGALFWIKDVYEKRLSIKKRGLSILDIYDAEEQAQENRDNGLADSTTLDVLFGGTNEALTQDADSFSVATSFTTVLPTTFNLGYVYTWDLQRISNQKLRTIADWATVSGYYQQHFTSGPGRSFIPRLAVAGEGGMLQGFLPLRAGFIFGGDEKLASTFGFGLNFDYVSLNMSYKAVGSPFWIAKRGLAAAAGLNINWGMDPDRDRDGIADKNDECIYDPEDIDGFEDKDGCPDLDNDADQIVDLSDKCPNDPEDYDNFEDEDGCPDFDNDQDMIADTVDQCPLQPEDRDSFEDQDGCPDPDNDGDGILDPEDKCPLIAEDIDGFEDQDGCPDYDNDRDGVADTLDQCPMKPEVFNGFKDEDGCPDDAPKPTEKEEKVLETKLRQINFKTGSAELTPNSSAFVRYAADFLKQYPHLKYEIQGHTDSRGSDEYNLLLSAARASTVRAAMIRQGVADSQVIAIGYGEQRPIASNRTAEGRALNRRVHFQIIDSKQQYEQLKIREEEFRERIREKKILGAQ